MFGLLPSDWAKTDWFRKIMPKMSRRVNKYTLEVVERRANFIAYLRIRKPSDVVNVSENSELPRMLEVQIIHSDYLSDSKLWQ